MCRNIRTTQERRANQGGQWIEDQGFLIFAKIRRTHLPNAWDDIIRRDYKERSWKRHRNTQYHVIDVK